MDKPKVLYRGISVDAKEFANLEIFGDIKPIAPPKKNAEGKDIVADGNEYGIYMTTSYMMAQDVYGNTHSLGGYYSNELVYIENGQQQKLRFPKLGIVYKINTSNLAIKEPWITQTLQGHYNNGYKGEEWITQAPENTSNGHCIPKESYVITDVVLGYDLLNNKQNIDISGLTDEEIKKKIIEVIEKRKLGYDLFLNQVKKQPPNLRETRIRLKMTIYKKLFNSIDGIAFTDYSNVDITNLNQVVNNLMQKVYNRDKENIDIAALDNIYKLSVLSKTTEDFEQLVNKRIQDLQLKLANPNLIDRAREHIKNELKIMNGISKFLEEQFIANQSSQTI